MKVYITNGDCFFNQSDYVQKIAEILNLGNAFHFEESRYGDKVMVFEVEDIGLKDLQAIANLATGGRVSHRGLIIRESTEGAEEVHLHIYYDYIE